MTAVDHDSLMRCRQHVLDALLAEAKNRDQAEGLTWIERERFVMAVAANTYADAHGLTPVTVTDIAGFEHQAVGHVDYASKIALYVSEWVHGLRPRR